MELDELKSRILIALYNRYKNSKSVTIDALTLCKEEQILYDIKEDVYNAVQSLVSLGYVNAVFTINKTSYIQEITHKGLLYAEILNKSFNNRVSRILRKKLLFETEPKFNAIKDSEVASCFGVEELADCFIEHMVKVAEISQNNVCFLGIFAPWGRGKTYFFQKVKENIARRGKTSMVYEIVEINAWKYQQTPAIWAYLFENIYKETCWLYRIKFWFKSNISCLKILVYLIVCFLVWLLLEYSDLFIDEESFTNALKKWNFPMIWITTIVASVYKVLNKPITALQYLHKYIKKVSFAQHLGVQNEIEKEIEKLLKIVISDESKKRLLLYVDDIDRCPSDKMLAVTESLRTILENDEIKKRLIVVCSLDPQKIIASFNEKNLRIYEKEDCRRYAREQLDKIFISSIGLPSLSNSEVLEFVRKLMEDQQLGNLLDKKETMTNRGSFNRSFSSSFGNSHKTIDDKDIYTIISQFLDSEKIEDITPRKMRIVYYQLWFAINVLSQNKEMFSTELAEAIIKKSISGEPIKTDDMNLKKIVDIVVPY